MKRMAMLFGGLVLGTPGVVQAEPVRFENHDDVQAYEPFWMARDGLGGLGITEPFAAHPLFPLTTSFFDVSLSPSTIEWNYSPQYGLTAFGGPPVQGLLVESLSTRLVLPLEAGDEVMDSSGEFGPVGIMAEATRDFDNVWYSFATLLPDSEVRYFGVRFPIDGEQHYGWVQVRLSSRSVGYPQIGTASGWFVVQILAWGYESEPDTPAVAGAPSCSSADIAAPYGALTFADITAFLTAFANGTMPADQAAPFEELTFADITAFLNAFSDGCP